ncbi:MAG: phosphorylcholine metabolism protein LicD [Hyperionvirus sp.]|uniref:Phosphorylcholine metabolism protein LicD n=1 Tax=Hyperionvirus sp. TaxID=2487770 RepID=A0A3G5ABS0_9VIRU|nr:MAG: phosphorylcholine metabolism protein LicD [Hyperionvirus sp.]
MRKPGLIYADPKVIYKLYKMIYAVKRVLEIYEINYWMEGGTLLGAVRHQGIIPWDEDADFQIFDTDEHKIQNIYEPLDRLGYTMQHTWWGYKIFPKDGAPIKGFCWKFPGLDIFVVEVIKTSNETEYTIQYKYPEAKKHFGKCTHPLKDLYPLKDYKFGAYTLKGPRSPYQYLDNCYDSDWNTVAYMQFDHEHEKKYKKIRITLTDDDRVPARPFFIPHK